MFRIKPIFAAFVPDHNIQNATQNHVSAYWNVSKFIHHFFFNKFMHNTIFIINHTCILFPVSCIQNPEPNIQTHINTIFNTLIHIMNDGLISHRPMDWHLLANMKQARSHRLLEMLAYLLNNMPTKNIH